MIDKIVSFRRKNDLSLAQSVLYHMIKNSDDFDYTNDQISEILGFGTDWVTKNLTKLKNLNLIYEYSFDGRRRVLKAR